jgi:hypothetical protein
MIRIFSFVLFFSVIAFASPVSDMGAHTVSLLEPAKAMLLGIAVRLLPLFVISFAIVVLVKIFLPRGLDRYTDYRMGKKGYERYEPSIVKHRGRYYRKMPQRKGD